jgi:protein-tyrosine phosphatase
LSYMTKNRKIIFKTMRNAVLAVVLFIVAGNVLILGANVVARMSYDEIRVPDLPGIANLEGVDNHLWRGAAPNDKGYKALARHDVRTVVDLRSDDEFSADPQLLKKLNIDLVRIPLRDGQAPTTAEVRRFMRVVENTEHRVFVNCGAGVGRTGTMAAAYLVAGGKTGSMEALGRNLAVGPPSLEQVAFVAGLNGGEAEEPPAAITLMSRIIDGPRRAWVRISRAYE